LKVIRWRTGSQCSWRRIGVMRSDLLAPVTRRAAAFWTDCSLVLHNTNPILRVIRVQYGTWVHLGYPEPKQG